MDAAGLATPALCHHARYARGAGWIYEIKHDGFRMMVGRNGVGVRLFTRTGTTGENTEYG
jgi:ATP-dependent DNA ligase